MSEGGARRGCSRASSSQGGGSAPTQPWAGVATSTVTVAPCGGSASSARRTASAANAASTEGGSRIDNAAVVNARRTLPASVVAGRPSIPITDMVARQARPRSRSVSSVPPSFRSAASGSSARTASGNSWATASAIARWRSGMGQDSSGNNISPVTSSSRRERSSRSTRNDEGTPAPEFPLWMPSVSTLGAHLDHEVAPQRRGEPQAVVGVTSRIEAHHEVRSADARGRGVEMRTEIWAPALLAGLDEDRGPPVGHTERRQCLESEERREGRVPVVTGAAAIETVPLADRRGTGRGPRATRRAAAACRGGRRRARSSQRRRRHWPECR